ncbi:unnamed protein product [Eretmochelys imbricata]
MFQARWGGSLGKTGPHLPGGHRLGRALCHPAGTGHGLGRGAAEGQGAEPVCLAGPAGGPPPDHPEPLPLHRLLVRPARRHREASAPAGPAAVPPLGADVLPEGACLWACRRGPRPLPSQRSAGVAPHRHPFPVGLAHDGGHGAESAPPDCGEPLQDPGCLPGRVPGLWLPRASPGEGTNPSLGLTGSFAPPGPSSMGPAAKTP